MRHVVVSLAWHNFWKTFNFQTIRDHEQCRTQCRIRSSSIDTYDSEDSPLGYCSKKERH